MDKRKTYRVNLGGIDHELLLTDQGAKRYGDRATLVEATEAPAEEEPEEKATEPQNKGRQTRNKS